MSEKRTRSRCTNKLSQTPGQTPAKRVLRKKDENFAFTTPRLRSKFNLESVEPDETVRDLDFSSEDDEDSKSSVSRRHRLAKNLDFESPGEKITEKKNLRKTMDAKVLPIAIEEEIPVKEKNVAKKKKKRRRTKYMSQLEDMDTKCRAPKCSTETDSSPDQLTENVPKTPKIGGTNKSWSITKIQSKPDNAFTETSSKTPHSSKRNTRSNVSKNRIMNRTTITSPLDHGSSVTSPLGDKTVPDNNSTRKSTETSHSSNGSVEKRHPVSDVCERRIAPRNSITSPVDDKTKPDDTFPRKSTKVSHSSNGSVRKGTSPVHDGTKPNNTSTRNSTEAAHSSNGSVKKRNTLIDVSVSRISPSNSTTSPVDDETKSSDTSTRKSTEVSDSANESARKGNSRKTFSQNRIKSSSSHDSSDENRSMSRSTITSTIDNEAKPDDTSTRKSTKVSHSTNESVRKGNTRKDVSENSITRRNTINSSVDDQTKPDDSSIRKSTKVSHSPNESASKGIARKNISRNRITSSSEDGVLFHDPCDEDGSMSRSTITSSVIDETKPNNTYIGNSTEASHSSNGSAKNRNTLINVSDNEITPRYTITCPVDDETKPNDTSTRKSTNVSYSANESARKRIARNIMSRSTISSPLDDESNLHDIFTGNNGKASHSSNGSVKTGNRSIRVSEKRITRRNTITSPVDDEAKPDDTSTRKSTRVSHNRTIPSINGDSLFNNPCDEDRSMSRSTIASPVIDETKPNNTYIGNSTEASYSSNGSAKNRNTLINVSDNEITTRYTITCPVDEETKPNDSSTRKSTNVSHSANGSARKRIARNVMSRSTISYPLDDESNLHDIFTGNNAKASHSSNGSVKTGNRIIRVSEKRITRRNTITSPVDDEAKPYDTSARKSTRVSHSANESARKGKTKRNISQNRTTPSINGDSLFNDPCDENRSMSRSTITSPVDNETKPNDTSTKKSTRVSHRATDTARKTNTGKNVSQNRNIFSFEGDVLSYDSSDENCAMSRSTITSPVDENSKPDDTSIGNRTKASHNSNESVKKRNTLLRDRSYENRPASRSTMTPLKADVTLNESSLESNIASSENCVDDRNHENRVIPGIVVPPSEDGVLLLDRSRQGSQNPDVSDSVPSKYLTEAKPSDADPSKHEKVENHLRMVTQEDDTSDSLAERDKMKLLSKSGPDDSREVINLDNSVEWIRKSLNAPHRSNASIQSESTRNRFSRMSVISISSATSLEDSVSDSPSGKQVVEDNITSQNGKTNLPSKGAPGLTPDPEIESTKEDTNLDKSAEFSKTRKSTRASHASNTPLQNKNARKRQSSTRVSVISISSASSSEEFVFSLDDSDLDNSSRNDTVEDNLDCTENIEKEVVANEESEIKDETDLFNVSVTSSKSVDDNSTDSRTDKCIKAQTLSKQDSQSPITQEPLPSKVISSSFGSRRNTYILEPLAAGIAGSPVARKRWTISKPAKSRKSQLSFMQDDCSLLNLNDNESLSVDETSIPRNSSTPYSSQTEKSRKRNSLTANKKEKLLSKSMKLGKMPDFAKIHKKTFEKMENVIEMRERKAARAKYLLSGQKPTCDTSFLHKSGTESRRELNFNISTHEKSTNKSSNLPNPEHKIPTKKTRRSLGKTENTSIKRTSLEKNKENQQKKRLSLAKAAKKAFLPVQVVGKQQASTSTRIPIKPLQRNLVNKPANSPKKLKESAPSAVMAKARKEPIPPIVAKAKRNEAIKAVSTKTKGVDSSIQDKSRDAMNGFRSNRRFDLLMQLRQKKK